VVGIVEARALFLLNMMNFTYVFDKSKNFIIIKCKGLYLCFFFESMIFIVIVMYEYYLLLKRK